MSQDNNECSYGHRSSAERLELVDELWDSIARHEYADDVTRDKRIKLAQDIWDSIPDHEAFVLTPELKAEIDRRLADCETNPHNIFTWEEVKARIKRSL